MMVRDGDVIEVGNTFQQLAEIKDVEIHGIGYE